jgi:hypothetical protein
MSQLCPDLVGTAVSAWLSAANDLATDIGLPFLRPEGVLC